MGVVVRHSRRCRVKRCGLDTRCTCDPTFNAWVYRGGRKLWRSFKTFSDASEWRKREIALGNAPARVLIERAKRAREEYRDAVAALRERAA